MKDRCRILVVDDELPVAKSIANALTDQEYIVDITLSGEEALMKEEEIEADIIIADMMMPGISGMDLLKIVKERRAEITVIMITGYPSIKSAVQAIKLGAFDYLPKPFTPNELRNLVSRAVERRRLNAEIELRKRENAEITIPQGLYYIPENSWAKVEADGNVRIGIHHIFISTIKDIVAIDYLPMESEIRYQGECLLWIRDSQNRIYRIWTPVSGRTIAVNEDIKKDYSKLINDPYKEGWVLIVEPIHLEEDLKNLGTVNSCLRRNN